MKRDRHHLYHPSPHRQPSSAGAGAGGGFSSCFTGAREGGAATADAGKSKEGAHDDGGMDELLAVLGYEVPSSKMAEVAQKLEQLEEVIGSAREESLSGIVSDTVHYNPSDLSTWLESILSDFQPLHDDPYFAPADSSHLFDGSSAGDCDLKAIPGNAVCSSSAQIDQANAKRLKSPALAPSSSSPWMLAAPPLPESSPERPLVLVDSQENGIRLVHTLTACAQAIQQDDLKVSEFLVKQIEFLAKTQAGAMGKVAAYFAKALALRIYGGSETQTPLDPLLDDTLEMHFYDSCPYLKFAHFTANQAILEAFAGKSRVHVIDFSMKQGMQWPALMHALALRPGGPPAFRLTGVGHPPPDETDHLREVGRKLAEFAKTMNVKFHYRGLVVDGLTDLTAAELDLRPGEAVAVNSVFELHGLLAVPGGIEKVLTEVREMRPAVVTVAEQEANHNGPVFLDRFMEALHFYSTMFDSLEGGGTEGSAAAAGGALSEAYLGRQIGNVVACEGAERVERHEPLARWRERFAAAGFAAAHIGSDAFRQASLLLKVFAGADGYGVEERSGCLMLGWHKRPLIAASAWQPACGG